MFFRSCFAIALLFVGLLYWSSYAQEVPTNTSVCGPPSKSNSSSNSSECNLDFMSRQVTHEVIVSGASLNDGYGVGDLVCGVDGQLYRPPQGPLTSIMRVSRDGSILMFSLPNWSEPLRVGPDRRHSAVWPVAYTPNQTGLEILARNASKTATTPFELYRFDSRASLITQHPLAIDFRPSIIATTNSGTTILLGRQADKEAPRYRGAVLGPDDRVAKQFELPMHTRGGEWKVLPRTAPGDGGIYVILSSDTAPRNAVAKISDEGSIDIRPLAVSEDSDKHHHNEWLFGPGLAVEVYHYLVPIGTLPRAFDGFDEYDLNTGEKVGTKGLFPVGFAFGCYTGTEVSMLAHSAHVDPARHLSADTIRLVTAKLR